MRTLYENSMAHIIWIFGIICAIHDSQSSLPFIEKVKARTRLCLGEGSHCPVNLPFSPCCKPYVCIGIPKTHRPWLLMNFTHFKDHRCLLPSSNIESVTQEPTLLDGSINATNSQLQDHEQFNTKIILVDNATIEFTTLLIDTNETFTNDSNPDSGYYDENYKKLLPSSNETYSDNNEASHSFILKRSVTDNLYKNNSENEYTSEVEEEDNNNGQLGSASSSSDSNFTSSSESKELIINSNVPTIVNSSDNIYDFTITERQMNFSNNYVGKLNEMSLNNTNNSVDVFNYTETNNTSPPSSVKLPSKTINSSDVSEEEWTSSDMTYDTRPGLHKVVTIHPFHLFKSVELVKLNESIESSD